MVRPTYAEIDLGAIRHNVRAFIAHVAPSELCAVVKADGYGHGDVPVATTAVEAGATRLAVALVEEGVRLREAGLQVPILVLSEPDPSSIEDIASWDLTPAVYTPRLIHALNSSGHHMEVHVKIDTGMHRVGAAPRDFDQLVSSILESPNLSLAGAFTHFPVAEADTAYTDQQIELFNHTIGDHHVPLLHMANTAGAVLFPEARGDFCRVGLGLYGLHPGDRTRGLIDLRPAMKIVSHVSFLKHLEGGSRPSYGRIRPLSGRTSVATVPIGYADGYSRSLTHEGSVLIRGRRHHHAGMVTMDQIVVSVSDDIEVGDEVVLMGDQGAASVTADEIADLTSTITHEVVTKFGPRVPRRYLG